ncbi:hypothetical protein CPB85DRAFT_1257370 [Mucidula mucida]|nr:hypothetical protein CPB85DRAFT_1257370 [Mucidula mucida]
MERSQDRVKTGRSGSALDNLGSPTFFLPFPHVEPLSYYDRNVNAVLPPSLGSLASASCPPRCRDVGIRLFDGSRRHLWDRIVARDDPVNIFDLTSPTGLPSCSLTILEDFSLPSVSHAFFSLISIDVDPRLTYFNDVDILVAFLKFLRLIKASMPLGSASPTTSLSTGSPYFSLCFSISKTLTALCSDGHLHIAALSLWLSLTPVVVSSSLSLTVNAVVSVAGFISSVSRCRIRASLWQAFEAKPTQHTVLFAHIPTRTFKAASRLFERANVLREVTIELMRNALDNLKNADTLREKTEKYKKVMLQDARTKEIFRELDRFIMLMSVLSTLRVAQDRCIHEPEAQILLEVLESIRPVFMIVSDVIHGHPESAEYFKDSVSFKSLSLAIRDLGRDKRTIDVPLGFLLSMLLIDFALSDFRRSGVFPWPKVDTKIQEFETHLTGPDAMRLLWGSVLRLVDIMRYAVYKLFELLCASCHHNHATLSTMHMGLVESFLSQYFQLRDDI